MTTMQTAPFPSIVTDFGFSPIQPAVWQVHPANQISWRDLSLAAASDDSFVGCHLRAAGTVIDKVELVKPDAAFAFFSCCRGR